MIEKEREKERDRSQSNEEFSYGPLSAATPAPTNIRRRRQAS